MKAKGELIPGASGRLVRHAQARYMERGESRAREAAQIRERTADIMCRALHEVLRYGFGVSVEDYEHIMCLVENFSCLYQAEIVKNSAGEAENWLEQFCIWHNIPKSRDFFITPIINAPKSRRDWESLHQERAAGLLAARFYAVAIKNVLEMSDESIKRVLEAVKSVYKMEYARYMAKTDVL